MCTVRNLLVALMLAGSLLFISSGAAAKGQNPNKPPKATITWSTPRLEQSVNPGQTVEVELALTSSVDLSNLTFQISGGLSRVVAIEPATIGSLKAGVATPVKVTITMPTTGAHSQAGVIQVRAGQRVIPSALKLKLIVPGTTGDTEDSQ